MSNRGKAHDQLRVAQEAPPRSNSLFQLYEKCKDAETYMQDHVRIMSVNVNAGTARFWRSQSLCHKYTRGWSEQSS